MAQNNNNNNVVLTGENFPTWKIQAKMMLIKENLYDIVDESETEPAPTSTNAADIAKFKSRKKRALAIIVLSIDPKLFYHLGDPTCPIAVWKKIQAVYQKET